MGRTTAASALVELVKRRPELRDLCIATLVDNLRRRNSQSPILNATLIGDLIDLKAVEVIGEIRAAFLDGVVDLTFNGDFQEVEIELGLRTRRTGPPRWNFPFVSDDPEATGAPTPTEADFRRAGRNDLCPCGSGIKFKKCCLNRTARGS